MSQPYRCPICYGRGVVPGGFYDAIGDSWLSGSSVPEPCRSCKRTGLVWEGEEVPSVQGITPEIEKHFSDQEIFGEEKEPESTV